MHTISSSVHDLSHHTNSAIRREARIFDFKLVHPDFSESK